MKTKEGLKKIRNLVSKNASASVCIMALWANTKKVDSYKDLDGGFISITLTGYHVTVSFGIGDCSAVAGFGVSTSRGNLHPRIKPTLAPGSICTDTRTNTHFVVTEYGKVNLKGLTTWERAEALISIAHPDFREELVKDAEKMGIWRKTNKR